MLVFFVLSGFVISYVAGKREDNWRSYTLSRAARIYSVALPALALTFVVDAYSPPLPDWIIDDSATTAPGLQFAAGVTFLNEVWGRHVQIGSNSPYWSLGYEVPFYLCFGLMVFLPRRWNWATLIGLALFGPRVAVMSLIWLIGVATQVVCSRRLVSPATGLLMLLASFTGWIAYNVLIRSGIVDWNSAPLFWHRLHDLPGDFFVALLFAGAIVGVDATFRDRAPPLQLKRAITWLAGATFTLYLCHVPITRALLAIVPLRLDTAFGKAGLIAAIIAATLLVAEVTERRKKWWQRRFAMLLSPRSNP